VKISFYVSENGRCNVIDFIKQLPSRERANVHSALDKITTYGLSVVETRQIDGKIWEFKTFRYNRFFYFIKEENSILIFYALKKQKARLENQIRRSIIDRYNNLK